MDAKSINERIQKNDEELDILKRNELAKDITAEEKNYIQARIVAKENQLIEWLKLLQVALGKTMFLLFNFSSTNSIIAHFCAAL